MEGLQSLRLKDTLYSQLVFKRNHFITKYMEIKIFIQQFEESLDGLDAGSVSETTAFKELKEWDSLAILTLTDTIDLEYGVLLKKADIESCGTVQSLFDLVQSKV